MQCGGLLQLDLLASPLPTIAGERLELNRVLRPTVVVRLTFVARTILVLARVTAALWWPEAGIRVPGAGLIALTWRLARNESPDAPFASAALPGSWPYVC
jgi:hypothetical protein